MEKTKNDEILLLKEEIKEINEEFSNKIRNLEEKASSPNKEPPKTNNFPTNSKLTRKESMYNYVELREKYISEIDQLKDEIENYKKEHAIWQARANSKVLLDNNELKSQITHNSSIMTESNASPIEKNKIETFVFKEKERKSRISSFFSKAALDKMVQEIQSSELMRKKTNLFSEKAIVDFKKTNEILTIENKRLTELVERVKSETNKNKEFIINNIQELEKKHKQQIQNLNELHEKKVIHFLLFFFIFF